ncbi:hypothetical protein Hanom_Chr07g00626151 [Helianthus anomalus]
MKDVNLIELAREPGQARARLVYKPSRAGSFTTEPISSRTLFDLFSSEFRTGCEPRVL